MTIEELVLEYGKEKLSQKIGTHLLTENRINTLLQLANKGANKLERLRFIKNKIATARINARVTDKHLWLSISNNFKSSLA